MHLDQADFFFLRSINTPRTIRKSTPATTRTIMDVAIAFLLSGELNFPLSKFRATLFPFGGSLRWGLHLVGQASKTAPDAQNRRRQQNDKHAGKNKED